MLKIYGPFVGNGPWTPSFHQFVRSHDFFVFLLNFGSILDVSWANFGSIFVFLFVLLVFDCLFRFLGFFLVFLVFVVWWVDWYCWSCWFFWWLWCGWLGGLVLVLVVLVMFKIDEKSSPEVRKTLFARKIDKITLPAPLFWPRIDFWSIFRSRNDPQNC